MARLGKTMEPCITGGTVGIIMMNMQPRVTLTEALHKSKVKHDCQGKVLDTCSIFVYLQIIVLSGSEQDLRCVT